MNVLAIDTTLGACSAAIYNSGELYGICELMERGHAERLMPMIKQLRAHAGVEFSEIDRIAVTTGPGTFTGVRIGIAAARGLALGLGCQIFHATSLQIIALKALKSLDDTSPINTLTVAMDARRGEVYLQTFDHLGRALNDAMALTPGDAIDKIKESAGMSEMENIVIGSAMDILKDAGLGADFKLPANLKDIQPDAKDLARLAANAPAAELMEHVSPLYLRAPDAKPQIGKSVLRAG